MTRLLSERAILLMKTTGTLLLFKPERKNEVPKWSPVTQPLRACRDLRDSIFPAAHSQFGEFSLQHSQGAARAIRSLFPSDWQFLPKSKALVVKESRQQSLEYKTQQRKHILNQKRRGKTNKHAT